MPGVKFLFQNFFNLIKFFLIEKCKPCKSNALLELHYFKKDLHLQFHFGVRVITDEHSNFEQDVF